MDGIALEQAFTYKLANVRSLQLSYGITCNNIAPYEPLLLIACQSIDGR